MRLARSTRRRGENLQSRASSTLVSLSGLDRLLELSPGNIAALEHNRAVDFHGRELRQRHPLQESETRLLHDFHLEGIGLLQLRDRGADIVSPAALRVVKIETDHHRSSSVFRLQGLYK